MTTLRRLVANPWGQPRFLAIVTIVYILWSLLPVLVAAAFAFNDGRSRTAWQGFSLRWVSGDPASSLLHDPTLRSAMLHSLELAVITMLVATPLGVALALGLQRWRGRGAAPVNLLMLIPLVTPELVMGVALFLLFTSAFGFLGLGTTAQAIGQVTFSISYVVVIVRGRLASIGRDYEEAAADLGAPPFEVIRRVLLPMLMPAIVASLLIVFALSIDDFVVTAYLSSGADTATVPILIYSNARGAPTPALNAVATAMLIPTLVALGLAYLVWRRFARGADQGEAFRSVVAGDV